MPPWGGRPTLWIRLDVTHAVNMYTSVEQLIQVLSEALGGESSDLALFTIHQAMEYVAIVPVVRGRLLSRNAWRLNTQSAIMSPGDIKEHLWRYVPGNPQSAFGSLDLPVWELDVCAWLMSFVRRWPLRLCCQST